MKRTTLFALCNRLACKATSMKSGECAHRLKNTVVYLGAQPATDAIVEVESAAKSGKMAALDQALIKLGRKAGRLKERSESVIADRSTEDRRQKTE